MKPKLLFLTLLLLFSVSFSSAEKLKLHANPINIANQLVQKSSLEKMAEDCRYYNFTQLESEDGYTVFANSHGAIIKFKVSDDKEDPKLIVECVVNENQKKVESVLSSLEFEKKGNQYQRNVLFDKQAIYCQIHNIKNQSHLVFTRKAPRKSAAMR